MNVLEASGDPEGEGSDNLTGQKSFSKAQRYHQLIQTQFIIIDDILF